MFAIVVVRAGLVAAAGLACMVQGVASLSSSGTITLGGPSTRVALSSADRRTLRDIAGRSLVLAVYDLHTDSPPGTTYQLYLDLPAQATNPRVDDPHFVGTINFFAAVRPGVVPAGSPAYSFDLSDVLKRLGAAKAISAETSVTIVATGPAQANARPTVGRIAILAP